MAQEMQKKYTSLEVSQYFKEVKKSSGKDVAQDVDDVESLSKKILSKAYELQKNKY